MPQLATADATTLKEFMTTCELLHVQDTQAIRLVVSNLDGRYFKDQRCTLVAYTVDGQEFPSCRYICIESGYLDARWQFECNIFKS